MSAKDGDFHRKQRNMSDAYFKTIRAKNFCPLAQTNECGIPEGSLSISACPENFLSTAGSSVTNADMTALAIPVCRGSRIERERPGFRGVPMLRPSSTVPPASCSEVPSQPDRQDLDDKHNSPKNRVAAERSQDPVHSD